MEKDLTIPVHISLVSTPDGGIRACASMDVSKGARAWFGVELTAECVRACLKRAHARAASMAKGAPFGWNPFRSVKRMVSKSILQKVAATAFKATMLPLAGRLASQVAKATGIPVKLSAIQDAYKLAINASLGKLDALRRVRELAIMAAKGSPMAVAAALVYKVAASRIPVIRKIGTASGADGLARQVGDLSPAGLLSHLPGVAQAQAAMNMANVGPRLLRTALAAWTC